MERMNYFTEQENIAQYLKEISNFQPLSSDREADLARKIHKGNKHALNQLVKANLRFVVSVARSYQHQGLPLEDLINEGNIGLMKAAERFDEKKNFRFISFAVWWIRQSILQALANQSRVTRVPLNRVGLIHKVGKMKDQLEQKFGRLPTAAEIAVELKIDKPLVEEALRIDAKPVSLEDQLDDTGRRAVKDTIRDDSSPLPDEISIDSSLTRNIEQYLDILTPRERTVIAHYFGLEDKVPKNLDQIGKIMRVTRERVRQLKENGLKRLKEAGLERLFTELVH